MSEFRIRPEQLHCFDLNARAVFHRRLAAFIRKESPAETETLNDTTLNALICEQERRAATYGVETEAGIAQWLCFSLVAGPRFDETPDVKSYLEDAGSGLSTEEKVVLLAEILNSGDKGAAEGHTQPGLALSTDRVQDIRSR